MSTPLPDPLLRHPRRKLIRSPALSLGGFGTYPSGCRNWANYKSYNECKEAGVKRGWRHEDMGWYSAAWGCNSERVAHTTDLTGVNPMLPGETSLTYVICSTSSADTCVCRCGWLKVALPPAKRGSYAHPSRQSRTAIAADRKHPSPHR